MPTVVRDGDHIWNKDDKLEEVKCMIPDRCHISRYDTITNELPI